MKKKNLTKAELKQALYFIWEWQAYVQQELESGACEGYWVKEVRRDSRKAGKLETTIRLILEAKS